MRSLTCDELSWISGGSEESREAGREAGEAAGAAVVNTIEFVGAVIAIAVAIVSGTSS